MMRLPMLGGLVCCFSASAVAGPEWMEMVDAGRVPTDAQAVTGTGDGVLIISGRLEGAGRGVGPGGGDFQDMYLIKIEDPEMFRATTLVEFDGFAEFDAQMFLFQPDGLDAFARLANLDAAPGFSDPLLLPISNDGSQAAITSPGFYYLAISGAPSVPVSASGPMFQFDLPTEVSGPDGNGGFDPIIDWSGPGATGDYRIGLRGVVSIPVNELGCDAADVAPSFGFHDMTDALAFITAYGDGNLLIADLAAPFGVLDFSDVLAFLLEFADGCP
ncbi:MAG: hypothetical protein ACIARR_11015 [Phycisphaerales bacterium JB059]